MAGEQVLIVDDEPTVLEACRRALTRGGIQVRVAASGTEALALLGTTSFDLLLTDVKMPDIDGLELLRRARACAPDLTTVALTGYGTLEVAIQAIRLGVRGFVLKPFTLEELAAAVDHALQEARLARENHRLKALLPLLEVSRALTRRQDVEMLYRTVARAAGQGTGATVSHLVLVPEPADGAPPDGDPASAGEGELRIVTEGDGGDAADGSTARPGAAAHWWPAVARYFARHAEPLRVDKGLPAAETAEAAAAVRALRQTGLQTAAVVPLSAVGELIGVLVVSKGRGKAVSAPGARPGRFDEGDLEWLGILANHAGAAIANARLMRELQATVTWLGEAEARQRRLFEALREPILITSAEGRISSFNAAATALFGHPGRLLDRPIQEVLPFIHAPLADPTQHQSWHGQIVDAAGQRADFEVSVTTLAEAGASDTRVYVVHDVSQHAELNRLREQLLHNVAHELRGPLSVLDTSLEILDTERDDLTLEEVARLIASARRTTRRFRNLMEDLLSAGNIQAGRFLVSPEPTPVSALVEAALGTAGPLVEARGQRVDMRLASEELSVLADRRYARQVLSNLLANASKYSLDGAVIRVRGEPEGALVRIAVEDTGPGIPPDQRTGLFERYYRVRPGDQEPGVGLGLAIAKGIVEAHGGSIGIDSEVGVGTTVWFTLPAG